MLSSTNIGLDLPRDIDPCVKWKTTPKGRRRGARRVRNSTSGESNRKKAAMTSSNGSENASDEEFKDADRVLASESEKLSVTILGRRFSDTIQSVPIKKRMRLQTGSSATPSLDCGQVSIPEAGSAFPVEDSSLDNHIDFSGISILADAACKSDEDTNNLPVSEASSPKGENGVAIPREALDIKSPNYDCISVPMEISSTQVVTTEALNNGSEKSSKSENVSRGSRLHWDLNTVMDVWDCDQQEGDGADYEPKTTVVACNTEMCNDYKEEADKDGNEDTKITCRNDEDVPELASPKSELHGIELRKEGAIFTAVDPKELIVESNIPPTDCSVPITPPFGPSSTKEELENNNEPYSSQLSASEHEHLSMCKPAEIKEEIEMAGSITDKPTEVDLHLEPPSGPELLLEVCIKEPATCASGSEPKDAMMDNNQTGTNAILGGDIVEHDSMAADDKLEHDALQSDCDRLADEKNQADMPHIETVPMLTNDNDNGHTTDEKADQQVDLTGSGKFSVEVDKHGNSVEFQSDHNRSDFYPPKKDIEEDDYQYEDGELREPAMHYWETDSFKLAENEHGPHEADERGDKQAVKLDPQSEENLLVADTGVQPDDCKDNNVIMKMDMDSNNQIELLQNGQVNNLGENESAENMNSSKLKGTGWDKQPESLIKNSESPSEQEIVAGASSLREDMSLCIDTLRDTDDPHRNDISFVRSRRSKEDELDGRDELNLRASRMHERGMPSRHSDTSRRDEHWVETRINTGRNRHRTTEFGAPSYAPSNSGNATAASIAKVKSNGFMVAPDGTLVKANGSCSTRKCQNSSSFYHGSPTERDHRGLGSSRERMVSPGRFGGIRGTRAGRCAVEPAREQYHRPTIEISPDRRRQRSFSPHRGHIRHISPSHIGSPSRSRTRSPHAWVSPPARGRCLADHDPRHERGRSPIHRMRTDYDDRIGAPSLVHSNHHHFPPHGLRCVNDRRCTSPGNIMRRSPPRNARFYQLDSPPPPLHQQRDEFYHHPVHSSRCNGFDHRRGFEDERYELVRPERTFQRSMNGDRFRPHNSSQKSFDSHRRSPPRGFNRGLVGDVNHRGKEDRDSFKFVTGGRHNNGKYEKREMRDRSSGGDDAAGRRRLP